MAELLLQTEQTYDFTSVPNTFIDKEMCTANGDFVKIYLYLLRCVQLLPEAFSISLIADRFDLTEKDVTRALRYWEKKQLLSLTVSGQAITGICLKHGGSSSRQETATTDNSFFYKKNTLAENEYQSYTPQELTSMEPVNVRPSPASAANAYQSAAALKPERPKKEHDRNNDNKRIQELLFLAEQYLGKPLTPDETMKIYYFHDTLHFSADLIEYLIEYCVSNDHKNMHYIEKVALSWAEKNIKTVREARDEGNAHNKDYFEILKAFGIRNRYPVDSEIDYMNKWLHTYHFDLQIVTKACDRTMKKGNQAAPFSYADKILTNWYKNGVVTPEDIDRLDAMHSRRQAISSPSSEKSSSNGKVNGVSRIGTSFNNFEQRTTDYEDLEKKLSQL